MQQLSEKNLRRAFSNIRTGITELATNVMSTFNEVYANMEELDEKIGGVSYLADGESIVIPAAIASYADETIIFK